MNFKKGKFIYLLNISKLESELKSEIFQKLKSDFSMSTPLFVESRNSLILEFPSRVKLNDVISYMDEKLGEESKVIPKKVLDTKDDIERVELGFKDMKIFLKKSDLKPTSQDKNC